MEYTTATLNSVLADPAVRPLEKKRHLNSVLEFFYHWESTRPDMTFLCQPVNGQWHNYTWKKAGDQIRRMASAIKAMGLPPKSPVGIVSKNCAHWVMSDIAIMLSGHYSVPLYPTLPADKLNDIILHSGLSVLFVGKLDEPNWEAMKDGIPGDVHQITLPYSIAEQAGVDTWDEVIAKHEPMSENLVPEREDLATIIYTSGTTGMPKGAMHTHYGLVCAICSAAEEAKLTEQEVGGQVRFFSYLPLSHVAERCLTEMGSLVSGGSITFVESLDTFADNLRYARPTHFLAVPRIWTKFQMGILEKMPQKKLDTYMKIPLLSSYVKNKIKKKLGLDKAVSVITGAAAMPRALQDWYKNLGIKIQDAYGMTETLACISCVRADNMKYGTVGQAYPSSEIKIDPETGEILFKSDWLMKGYYKEPKKTEEMFIGEWMRTGDMGEMDAEGFLKITGRVKDQFKSAKGEFIVPGPIEAGYATNHNIEQVCVVGRALPQPLTLVVLSELGIKLANNNKQALVESLEATLDSINSTLIHYEKVKGIVIAQEGWTVENNCLTPSLKVKRNILEDKYGPSYQEWYDHPDRIMWE